MIKLFSRLIHVLIIFAGFSACRSNPAEQHLYFYVGSSQNQSGYPIHLCRLDARTGYTEVLDSFPGSQGSSYLVLSADQQFMYAVDRRISDSSTGAQSVSSFRVNENDYTLEYLNSQSSQGSGSCHIYCNADRSFLFTANYSGGSIAALPVSREGYIEPASEVIITEGSGPNRARQERSHPHYVSLDPSEKFLLVPDLGSDRVLIFRFEKSNGKLYPNPSQTFLMMEPGAGPRHLAFHPSGKYLYILNELNGTLAACSYSQESGTIREINTLSTLSENHTGSNYSAAVRVHPSGKFVYASNRGDVNSIAVFGIMDDGSVELIQVQPEIPAWPRDFNIDPSGKFLLVAGLRSHEIEVFNIEEKTGKITPSGEGIDIIAPGNITFRQIRP
jgi:6-phosphogluconolactonase